MARLNVNPTRMVLTSLKKKLTVATRGHKLMKDKRDELMKQFLELARQCKTLREVAEQQLTEAYQNLALANAVMSREMLEEALMYPKQAVSIDVKHKNVMSVDVPVFDFETTKADETDIFPYGFATTSGDLDKAIECIVQVIPTLLSLAAMEKEAHLLADEIEKTRRRVNALEYVMIPDLKETIKYIKMKLDENERGNQTRLMKVKDMMLKQAILEKQKQDQIVMQEYRQKHANA